MVILYLNRLFFLSINILIFRRREDCEMHRINLLHLFLHNSLIFLFHLGVYLPNCLYYKYNYRCKSKHRFNVYGSSIHYNYIFYFKFYLVILVFIVLKLMNFLKIIGSIYWIHHFFSQKFIP